SMVESRLEKGVIWVGANDGPVSVSRDNGKTWKRVTPQGLVGARIQTIEDSPHQKGRVYIAAYRTTREHDLKPYIYRTDNYGETWTLLTDGKNGIPIDHPTRVVREDPRQPGLLYVGTEFAAFVSFDAGKHFQTLQQNLPNTPVTDLKVFRNDLVVSTMGRSLWIMDDVTPLQQLAALAMGAGATAGAGHDGGDAARQAAGGRASLPAIALFQPREAMRFRNATASGGAGGTEYTAGGAHFDLYFQSAPAADTKLEVTDLRGQVLHAWAVVTARAGAPQGRGGFFRPSSNSAGIRPEAGMQRITWDLRFPGPWTPNTPDGGPGGPMVPPGRYTVKLTSGGQTITRTLDIKTDPRVAGDGVTDADIAEQVKFQLQVRDAIGDARKLQQRIEDAMQKAGVKAPGPAAPGDTPANTKYANPLQQVWAQVVTTPGIYTQGMLIDQLQNVQREVNQADQKIGKDSYDRYADLMKELAALEAQLKKITGS
ncbi:MAG: hypothetical protein ABI665_29315, partial [Vicinamibacterales bacterium]